MSAAPAGPLTGFTLPATAGASEPPEARGLTRDGVRLLVAEPDQLHDSRFHRIGDHLRAGDLLVVNTSATRAGAIDGLHNRFGAVVVHLSTPLPDGSWVVEVRRAPDAGEGVWTCRPQDRIRLAAGPVLDLLAPYAGAAHREGTRLWRTGPVRAAELARAVATHGRPIRYGHLAGNWPLQTYQTVFADPHAARAGAEMPSAGRPFSADLVTDLVSRGIRVAPLALHCGVSSTESGEAPPAEFFEVPASTADLVNWTRRTGGRVIAVGTTVTRALESAADPTGQVHPAHDWTDLVIYADRPVRVVDALITGWHDPDASHLLLLEAVAGPELVGRAYRRALDAGYRWHEFGDSCLFLPRSGTAAAPATS